MTDELLWRLDRLESRLAAVEAENAALRAARPAPVATAATPAPSPEVGRRGLLRTGLAVAGAAAAGVVLADVAPAAAASGDTMRLGVNNEALTPTNVTHNGGGFALGAETYGAAAALYGKASGSSGVGVRAAGRTHLLLDRDGGRVPPFQDTVAHIRGEVVMDAYSNLWFCVADGTPGTWRSLAGNGSTGPGAGSLYPLSSPIRVYDSRPGTTPAVGSKTRLAAGVSRTLDMKANGTGIYGGVPVVVLNLLLVNATAGNGNLTVWAAGRAKPQANSLVWGGSAGRFSTVAFSQMDAQGRVDVNASLATDLVVDVVGYYR